MLVLFLIIAVLCIFLEWGCLLRKLFTHSKDLMIEKNMHLILLGNELQWNWKTVTSLSKVFSKLPFQKTLFLYIVLLQLWAKTEEDKVLNTKQWLRSHPVHLTVGVPLYWKHICPLINTQSFILIHWIL